MGKTDDERGNLLFFSTFMELVFLLKLRRREDYLHCIICKFHLRNVPTIYTGKTATLYTVTYKTIKYSIVSFRHKGTISVGYTHRPLV